MFDTLEIQNFRGFSSFTLSGLTRINLIIGKNNVGKTSLLEAIEIVSQGGKPSSLLKSPSRRGEISSDPPESRIRPEYDIRHLFHQHRIVDGTYFMIQATAGINASVVACEISPASSDIEELELFPEQDDQESSLKLTIHGPENVHGTDISISANGILGWDFRRGSVPSSQSQQSTVVFLGTEGADAAFLQRMWDGIVLTPEEDKVVNALQIIDQDIERLAFTSRDSRWPATAWVKLKHDENRVPLGSLGDGIRRLLSLAVYIARASGGILLVDEIDTGLHYSTLELMWRFIVETALRLDVQVFATTHSGDCLRALAWLSTDMPQYEDEISVFRIEDSAGEAVKYSLNDIQIANRHQIEVRG
jgi:ABC-type branched-subunit amino acid transport system ATPase component